MLQFYLMLIYKNKCVVLEYHTEYMLYFFPGTFVIGYEPAGLTVHPPPPPNDRGWVHFFRMGV